MVIALPVLLALGLITLAPAVFGLIVAAFRLPPLRALGTRRVVLALGVLGALAPVVFVPLLANGASGGDPIALRPFGPATGLWSFAATFWTWAAPMYRVDALTLYLAAGVAYLVTPLLIWMAFAARTESVSQAAGAPADNDANEADDLTPLGGQIAGDGMVASTVAGSVASTYGGVDALRAARLVRGVALALGIEAAALTLVFADGLVLVGVAWLVLVALAWWAGEINGESAALDRVGLVASLVGPALWLAIMVFAAVPVSGTRLMDLTGQKALPPLACIGLAVAIALAGGAMPFLAWVLRRAALAAPVGLGALMLAVLPAALYAGLRTYSVAADQNSHWPQIGAAQPPVTAGIAFAVLGAATIAIAGILALGRRDVRGLVALLALAQVGWGLVGLGVGQPVSVVGVLALLPAAGLGLAAMLASALAEDVVTNDEVEPDASGPAPLGIAARPLALAAWIVGGLSLIGLPFLPGFAARHLVTAGMVQTSGLAVPLVGLSWAGDGLLALALLRATAPALGAWMERVRTGGGQAAFSGRDVPGVVLAVLALALGIAPAGFLGAFGMAAAVAVLAPGAAHAAVVSGPFGYVGAVAQWPSVLAWVAGLVVAGLWLALRSGGRRRIVPVFAGGWAGPAERGETGHVGLAVTADRVPGVAGAVAAGGGGSAVAAGGGGSADTAGIGATGRNGDVEVHGDAVEAGWDDVESNAMESGDEDVAGTSLSEPEIAWSDLAPAFASAWTVPAGQWLLDSGDAELPDDDETFEPDGHGQKRAIAAVAEEADHAGD